ncbi:hypothetical protein Tco_1451737, partial [Tanacetum coccineum]
NITIPLINTNKEDKVSWISQSEEKQKFSMSIVYHDLKNDNEDCVLGLLCIVFGGRGTLECSEMKKRDWQTILQLICKSVKLRLMGFKVKNSSAVKNVADNWGLPNVKRNGLVDSVRRDE